MNFIDFHPFPYSDRPDTPGEALFPKVDPKTSSLIEWNNSNG